MGDLRAKLKLIYFLRSDVSWGTKGDNKVSTDLGVVKTNKGENAVEVAVPTAETDINSMYEDAIHVLSTKPPKEEKKVDPATEQEDFYRNFRTKYVCVSIVYRFFTGTEFILRVVCCWLGCCRMLVDLTFTAFCLMLMLSASPFRHCWSLLFCKHMPFCTHFFARAHTVCSTTNGSAKTSGANQTVNGYLIFILYSVVFLARAFTSTDF